MDPALELFAAHERELPAVRELAAALSALARAPDLGARVDGLERLAAWTRASDAGLPWPAGEPDPAGGDARYRRLGVLVSVLERSPPARAALAGAVLEALAVGDALVLFAEAGLSEHRAVFEEAFERLQRLLLPAPRDEHDLGRLLGRLLPDEEAAQWFGRAPEPLIGRLAAALPLRETALVRVREALGDALLLLASRAESIGLSRALRERREPCPLRASPWHHLPRRTEALVLTFDQGSEALRHDAAAAWRDTLAAARRENRAVLDHFETAGISIDLVHAIEACARMLDRMELLAGLRLSAGGPARIPTVVAAIAALARERARSDSLFALARDTSRQLARRVVERAGQSGEHYIASGPRDYAVMWASAAWGGVLTVGTAALKLVIASARLAPLPEGLLAGANYAASFTLLQATHGTLATKQPSMTAATLAGILEQSEGRHRAEELATFVARIVRSQIAAACGNVIAVAIGAYLFDRLWLALRGEHFIAADKAQEVLASMHLTDSATWWFAALTGVILWLSSVLAGGIENWAIYRRIPRAIAEHALGARLGRPRMQRLADRFARNLSAYAGSIVLGFLLGLAPAIGQFTGLPIDVRHVTLSTGQVAFAASSLGTALDPRVGFAMGGVALMFVLNLGVSFALALSVATRARGVGPAEKRALRQAVLRRIARRPLEFVLPGQDRVAAG
ncbi:MAG: hypothetical protein JNK02_08670 [Planctomycetes bacterium]|nr:hypothetical protein [Planctomycetota bacterium]